jgi:isochorismate pyruvate lyase
MTELRAAIDQLDQELIDMLARRARYIDRAAELKPAEAMPARIASRVEQVVINVRNAAESRGLEPDLAETLWRPLIDWSIRREEKILGPSAPQNEEN